jgi:rhodanese-related sulfurtransferase
VQQGAIIIDVRTRSEYKQGHVKKSTNMPLNELSNHIAKLKKDSVIITCCASGMRSASAKNILNLMVLQVYNGGGWSNTKKLL